MGPERHFIPREEGDVNPTGAEMENEREKRKGGKNLNGKRIGSMLALFGIMAATERPMHAGDWETKVNAGTNAVERVGDMITRGKVANKDANTRQQQEKNRNQEANRQIDNQQRQNDQYYDQESKRIDAWDNADARRSAEEHARISSQTGRDPSYTENTTQKGIKTIGAKSTPAPDTAQKQMQDQRLREMKARGEIVDIP